MNTKINKNHALYITVFTFVIIYLYAVIRHMVFGNTELIDLPLYITNKALSFTSIILISLSFCIDSYHLLVAKLPENKLFLKKELGLYGFVLALVHIILSFIAFNTDVYNKFFNDDCDLTNAGAISLLAGLLAYYLLYKLKMSYKIKAKTEDNKNIKLTKKLLALGVLFLTFLHLFFMGISSWISPQDWSGNMPPISLIAFVVVFISFILNLINISSE